MGRIGPFSIVEGLLLPELCRVESAIWRGNAKIDCIWVPITAAVFRVTPTDGNTVSIPQKPLYRR
jgi:hypothetical protein